MLSKEEYAFMQNNLRSMGFASYSEFLLSEWWQMKQEAIYEAKVRVCEICGSIKKISIHHKTYEHLGNEPLKDIMVLCSVCHLHEHNRIMILSDVCSIK